MSDDTFARFVLDQLAGMEGVTQRRMFGGQGLYAGKSFFGILYDHRVYLLTDSTTRDDFIARGMEPFRPSERQTLKRYFEVPPEILEDGSQLRIWVQRSIRVALERGN